MFIYSGNLGNCDLAEEETITIVFPASFELHDPVSAYWQWSKDPKNKKKASFSNSGHIHSVTKFTDGQKYQTIHFSFGSYRFEGTPTSDFTRLKIEYPSGSSMGDPFTLNAMHTNHASVRSAVVYTGNLRWGQYARGEMSTLVVPYGVVEGAFFGLYYRWTSDPVNGGRENVAVNGVFQNIHRDESDGTLKTTYTRSGYKYDFTFKDKQVSLVLSHDTIGGRSQDTALAATYVG